MRRRCCCTEETPCDPCPIACTIEGTPSSLPEYYWLDITVDSSPNCCGGDWASGCWLLRNAESVFGPGTDPLSGAPNCAVYVAVDPDDVDTPLYAPEGYFDEDDGADGDGVCGTGFSTTLLIHMTVGQDAFVVIFTVAEIDAPNSTPTNWTNFNNYVYSSSPSTIADYCGGPFTLDKDSGFVSCWPTEGFPTPPNNTAWPATATLTAADCESPRDCQFNFTPDPCAWLDGPYDTLIVTGTIGGLPIKVCLSFEEGSPDNWNGVQIVDLGCGDVELLLKLYCVSPDWFLEVWIDGVLIDTLDVTIDDPLGTTGTVSDPLNPVCGGSEAMVASIDPCAGDLPFTDCCDPETYNPCCIGAVTATGGIEESFPGSCAEGCTTSSVAWGYAFGNPTNSTGNMWAGDRWYWLGPVPISGPVGATQIYLSCNGGSWELNHTDSLNDDVAVPASFRPGFTYCPTPSGVIELGFPTDDCCGGGAGIYTVTLT